MPSLIDEALRALPSPFPAASCIPDSTRLVGSAIHALRFGLDLGNQLNQLGSALRELSLQGVNFLHLAVQRVQQGITKEFQADRFVQPSRGSKGVSSLSW